MSPNERYCRGYQIIREKGRLELTKETKDIICVEGCTSDRKYRPEVKEDLAWCERCAKWFHEGCLNPTFFDIDKAEGQDQGYLNENGMEGGCPDFQMILHLPVRREGNTGQSPLSYEILVVSARALWRAQDFRGQEKNDWLEKFAKVLGLLDYMDFENFRWSLLGAEDGWQDHNWNECPVCGLYV